MYKLLSLHTEKSATWSFWPLLPLGL